MIALRWPAERSRARQILPSSGIPKATFLGCRRCQPLGRSNSDWTSLLIFRAGPETSKTAWVSEGCAFKPIACEDLQ